MKTRLSTTMFEHHPFLLAAVMVGSVLVGMWMVSTGRDMFG